jgi:hypothetical protein
MLASTIVTMTEFTTLAGLVRTTAGRFTSHPFASTPYAAAPALATLAPLMRS